jgi:cystathionine beta-synthase
MYVFFIRAYAASHIFFTQVNNPLAHELTTAPEIIAAVTSTPPNTVHPSSGKVDVFIASAGTGGTVSGVAKGIKRAHNPGCIVVAVDPVRYSYILLTSAY